MRMLSNYCIGRMLRKMHSSPHFADVPRLPGNFGERYGEGGRCALAISADAAEEKVLVP